MLKSFEKGHFYTQDKPSYAAKSYIRISPPNTPLSFSKVEDATSHEQTIGFQPQSELKQNFS